MSSENVAGYTQWYVLQTKPRQEDRADSNLTAWNIETLTPKLRERRSNPYTGIPMYVIKPLFPRYIFARFNLSDSFHKVRFTRGVNDIVTFGDRPVPVDDEMIALIRCRMDKDGLVKIGEHLTPGDKVVVKDSPLGNFAGVFEREIHESDRVMILLQTVSYQVHVCVGREFVRKASPAKNTSP